VKRVLMVAFHFPPLVGSSGIQRTRSFVRYLSEFQWEPIIVSASPRAYEQQDPRTLSEIPDQTKVFRAPAWDAARHFAVRGRYPGFIARPDRWVSWWPGAVACGIAAAIRYRPSVIWSTYPITTAHLIAWNISKATGIPWVSDFRDPMVQEDYPKDLSTKRMFQWVEHRTVYSARRTCLVTPGAMRIYKERYPKVSDRFRCVANGFDETAFCDSTHLQRDRSEGRSLLLHSGIVYPSERDPRQLFQALALIQERHPEISDRLALRFRAPVHEQIISSLAAKYNVTKMVEVCPSIEYREALAEMQQADGLVIMQASNCNEQIPAKLYEYLRCHRPILGLTDPAGDTAGALYDAGIDSVAPIDDAEAIYRLLLDFIKNRSSWSLPTKDLVANYSRYHRTRELAEILQQVCSD